MTHDDDPIGGALRSAIPADPDHLGELRDRLAATADGEGVLDVAYRTIDSPVGSLLLATTSTGLVRVAFASEGHADVLQTLADRIGARILRAPRRLDECARQLDEYFAGTRRTFDLRLDRQLSSGFRAVVLGHLPEIAYGRTASYSTVAQLAGRPRAVRAVGTACAGNPLPVVVPCHRVVRSDGGIGGYLGGVEAKTALLALESAA